MHPRPALADLRNDARHLLDRAVAARNVGKPLAGQQQVPTAEHGCASAWQTLSPCLTPSFCKPLAMRSARSATSSWLRLRGPLMTQWKSWEVSVIALFFIGEH